MEFKLTYAGSVLGASNNSNQTAHKHSIRRVWHRQLKRLWDMTSRLQDARAVFPESGMANSAYKTRIDWLADKFQRGAYNFVPLVTADLGLFCDVSILFLRPDPPGKLIKSGDLDNRLKTIFDSLRKADNDHELPRDKGPMPDETPFYCRSRMTSS